MNAEIEQLEKATLEYANKTPLVLSLLYDIDMMPEQIAARAGAWEKRRTRDWYRMLLIVSALHFAAEGKSIVSERYALPRGGAERRTMNTKDSRPASLAAAHGSALLARLYNHRAMMAAHQKERHTGKLLLECIAEIERLNDAIRLTLEENCHLADGDNCTLLRLKRAYAQNARVSDEPPRQETL